MLNSVKSILYSGYIKKKSIFLGNTYGSIHLGVKCHDACNLFSNAWHVCVCKAGREGERERRKERDTETMDIYIDICISLYIYICKKESEWHKILATHESE